jgi:hypothetical protein
MSSRRLRLGIIGDFEPSAARFVGSQRNGLPAKRSYLASYFKQPWQGILDNRARSSAVFLDDAGILVMDDKPGEVDGLIGEFLKSSARN